MQDFHNCLTFTRRLNVREFLIKVLCTCRLAKNTREQMHPQLKSRNSSGYFRRRKQLKYFS